MLRRWSSTTRILVIFISIILLAWVILEIRPLIGPLLIAGLLAYSLNLLVRFIKKRTTVSHKWIVNIIYFAFIVVVVATPGTLVPVAVSQARELSEEFLQLRDQLEVFLGSPVIILGRTVPIDQIWAEFVDMTPNFGSAAEGALAVLETTSVNLLRLLIIFVTSYYLLMDWQRLRGWLVDLLPDDGRPDFEKLLGEVDIIWRSYMQGTLALMLIVAVVFTIIGFAIGLPGAIAIGLVTGILSMIPEIGPWISGVIAVFVAFLLGSHHLPISNLWFAAIVAMIYLVLMQVKSIWLRPQVMGRFMDMHTGIVFLAIIAAAMLQGILAALVVLPILATVAVLGRYVRARLLNIDPWTKEVIPETSPEVTESSEEEGEVGDDSTSERWQSA